MKSDKNSNNNALTVVNSNKIISIKKFDEFDEDKTKITFENMVFIFFILHFHVFHSRFYHQQFL